MRWNFVTMTITSLSSGALFTIKSWEFMNIGALPVLALTAVAVMWLALQRSNSRAATLNQFGAAGAGPVPGDCRFV